MTAPQKKVHVETSTSTLLDWESSDGDDRGPANAVIAKLAAAIAEQNAAKQTFTGARSRTFKWRPLAALALGSATLWVIAILAIWSLL